MKIVISEEIAQAIQLLPAQMQATFFSLYFAFVTTGAEPDDTVAPEVRAMFILAKPQIERLNRAAIRKRENPPSQPTKPAEPAATLPDKIDKFDPIQVEPSHCPRVPDEFKKYKALCDIVDEKRMGKSEFLMAAKSSLMPYGYSPYYSHSLTLLYRAMIDLYNNGIRPDTPESLIAKVVDYLPEMVRKDVEAQSPWLPYYALKS